MGERDLFNGIRREHIVKAIQAIDNEGYPPRRKSSTYDLVFQDAAYPPKYVLSLAGYFRDKSFIPHTEFEGGEETVAFSFLRTLDFVILPKAETAKLRKPKEAPNVDQKYLEETGSRNLLPPFFTEEDFKAIAKYTGRRWERKDKDMLVTYEYLANTYKKVEYWAQEIKRRLFPEGRVTILKKPINRAGNFEAYLWAKIYPTNDLYEWRCLAYTVTFSNPEEFYVKIDTVSLKDNEPLRKRYIEYRGDFFNSSIVKIFRAQEILTGSWEELISKSVAVITALQNDYQKLLSILDYRKGATAVSRSDDDPDADADDDQDSEQRDGYDKIPFHLDRVEDTDRLNREPIAKSLARLINNEIFAKEKKNDYSFMIHLQGAWGDGKSRYGG